MNRIYPIILIFLIAVIIGITFAKNTDNQEESATLERTNYPLEIIEICMKKNNMECHAECLDGYTEDCYFDSFKYNMSDSKDDMQHISDEDKNKCIGIHSYSVCGDCHNTFELMNGNEQEPVSCEEFFSAIEKENEECGGCIDTISAGCC